MAAIARTIIILLNYLVVYHAYGAFEGSVGTKKSNFFPAKNPVDARWEVVESAAPKIRSKLDIQPPQSTNLYREVRYKERGHTPTL